MDVWIYRYVYAPPFISLGMRGYKFGYVTAICFQLMCIYRKLGKRVRSCRARRVYYTTSPEYETETESGGCAEVYL